MKKSFLLISLLALIASCSEEKPKVQIAPPNPPTLQELTQKGTEPNKAVFLASNGYISDVLIMPETKLISVSAYVPPEADNIALMTATLNIVNDMVKTYKVNIKTLPETEYLRAEIMVKSPEGQEKPFTLEYNTSVLKALPADATPFKVLDSYNPKETRIKTTGINALAEWCAAAGAAYAPKLCSEK